MPLDRAGDEFRKIVADKVFELLASGFLLPIHACAMDARGSTTVIRYDRAGDDLVPKVMGEVCDESRSELVALPLMIWFRDPIGQSAGLQFNPAPPAQQRN